MDTCLAQASPMDKWFLLTANMAMSWLEIAAFVVLMEDGILLCRNVKVSNSSTSQEKFLRIYCGLFSESSIFLQYERVCQKSTETPSTFILVLFTSFIFVATTYTAKTEKYIGISTGEYFPFS